MLSNQKKPVEKILEPIAEKLSHANPNTLSLLGSIPSLLFFVFVITHLYIWAVVIFFGSLFDLLDGMIARKYNKVSNFGGFLDSTLDRVSDFFIITAFSFGGIVRWEITAPLLLFSFLTSYIRSRAGLAIVSHSEFAIGLIERPERLVLIFIALAAYLLFPHANLNGLNAAELLLTLTAILSLMTVLQRVVHAYKKL